MESRPYDKIKRIITQNIYCKKSFDFVIIVHLNFLEELSSS